jgi:hypothetical protein
MFPGTELSPTPIGASSVALTVHNLHCISNAAPAGCCGEQSYQKSPLFVASVDTTRFPRFLQIKNATVGFKLENRSPKSLVIGDYPQNLELRPLYFPQKLRKTFSLKGPL